MFLLMNKLEAQWSNEMTEHVPCNWEVLGLNITQF
jgi:hypothetical protein